ncbi:RNA polymerase II holoenzyme cyclin-like subunit [Elasticomyces elasticus]|nr:RNA polymerase II holoenzyme cyclin-like subunit [Elasticomyces elasticus]KAK3630532.1 RNA polymerase II holoenzyme cyclin-like subunit [Elasticomyces elasticus]KAK4909083.1 RNA polymerase II holoenzyme cyclin-like subunit [Elasticomyces elasticus]KAK5748452.1 RNA polymerase II holoenzyme cyclin-like subunit [Elasticomyces elasticus]
MASNYWDSTQAKYFTFSKSELANIRLHLAQSSASKAPMPEQRHLAIYIQGHLIKFARRQTNIRQQALATAQIYLKRFYLCVDFRKTNIYLLMATALYLACKMEETPLHIRLMLGESARQWPELGVSETGRLGECEFALISTLQSRLILHHPYRALGDLQGVFGLGTEEAGLATSIINDSYATDLPLLYPPHIIAITAIFLAVVLRPAGGLPAGLAAHSTAPAMNSSAAQNALAGFAGLKQAGPKLGKLVDWLAESKVDMESIVDATQEMVSLYECWEGYSERAVKEAITKILAESRPK